MKKKKILVFTGAGIDKESGIDTFRDSDGLWEKHSVDEVASVDGWNRNPQKVLDFYNEIRSKYSNVEPNDAHKIIANLENYFDVVVATQNVSNLHERAGSTKVIHLHGEITKIKSEKCDLHYQYEEEYNGDIKLGDKCPEGGQMRPDVVWFGEDLDIFDIEAVKREAADAVACVIIGTSMQVQPAASIPWLTKETTLIYYVDPSEIEFYIPTLRSYFFYHFKEKATIGTKMVFDDLFKIFIKNQKSD